MDIDKILESTPATIVLVGAVFTASWETIKFLFKKLDKQKHQDEKMVNMRLDKLEGIQAVHKIEITLLKKMSKNLEDIPRLVTVLTVETKHLANEITELKAEMRDKN